MDGHRAMDGPDQNCANAMAGYRAMAVLTKTVQPLWTVRLYDRNYGAQLYEQLTLMCSFSQGKILWYLYKGRKSFVAFILQIETSFIATQFSSARRRRIFFEVLVMGSSDLHKKIRHPGLVGFKQMEMF